MLASGGLAIFNQSQSICSDPECHAFNMQVAVFKGGWVTVVVLVRDCGSVLLFWVHEADINPWP
jgi:hypothetical protein